MGCSQSVEEHPASDDAAAVQDAARGKTSAKPKQKKTKSTGALNDGDPIHQEGYLAAEERHCGLLHITVSKAENVITDDSPVVSDPCYVQLSCAGRSATLETSTQTSTKSGGGKVHTWGESFELKISAWSAPVSFTIKDGNKEDKSAHKALGTASIPTNAFPPFDETTFTLDCDGECGTTITVKATFEPYLQGKLCGHDLSFLHTEEEGVTDALRTIFRSVAKTEQEIKSIEAEEHYHRVGRESESWLPPIYDGDHDRAEDLSPREQVARMSKAEVDALVEQAEPAAPAVPVTTEAAPEPESPPFPEPEASAAPEPEAPAASKPEAPAVPATPEKSEASPEPEAAAAAPATPEPAPVATAGEVVSPAQAVSPAEKKPRRVSAL